MFLSKELDNFYFYELIVDEKNYPKKIVDKIPIWIKRYFDREDFIWIRYYVLDSKKDWIKVAVWIYRWSAWRGNDYTFKKFTSKHNIEKHSFNLTDLIDYLE